MPHFPSRYKILFPLSLIFLQVELCFIVCFALLNARKSPALLHVWDGVITRIQNYKRKTFVQTPFGFSDYIALAVWLNNVYERFKIISSSWEHFQNSCSESCLDASQQCWLSLLLQVASLSLHLLRTDRETVGGQFEARTSLPSCSSFRGWKWGSPSLASLEEHGEELALNLHLYIPCKLSDEGSRASCLKGGC